MKVLQPIFYFFEKKTFGVCEWWGKKLGLPVKNVRMYFVYLSFFTAGSPIILYFIMAFILEHKKYFKQPNTRNRNTIWEL